jgi:hypothetical protein
MPSDFHVTPASPSAELWRVGKASPVSWAHRTTAHALGSTSYRWKTTRTACCTASLGSSSNPRSPHTYPVGAASRRTPRRALCCRAPWRRRRSQWSSASDIVPFNSRRSLSS